MKLKSLISVLLVISMLFSTVLSLCAADIEGEIVPGGGENVQPSGKKYTVGDADGNGAVDARDSDCIRLAVENGSGDYSPAGDVFADGKMNARDVLLLKACFAHRYEISDFDSDEFVYRFLICGVDISAFTVISETDGADYLIDAVFSACGVTLGKKADPYGVLHGIYFENASDKYDGYYRIVAENGDLHIISCKSGALSAAKYIASEFLGCDTAGEMPTAEEYIRFSEIPEGYKKESESPVKLTKTYDRNVKSAIEKLIVSDGVLSAGYDGHSYALFDIGAVSAVDLERELIYYMTSRMAFPHSQKLISDVTAKILTELGSENEYYPEFLKLRSSVTSSYKSLKTEYKFGINGLSDEEEKTLSLDATWQKFASSMLRMEEICRETGYINIFFNEMTSEEIYTIAENCFNKYKGERISKIEFVFADKTYDFTVGDGFSDSAGELWSCLSENGIDVWLMSNVNPDVLRAFVDVYGLHLSCTGVIGKCAVIKSGRQTFEIDAENAYPYRSVGDEWMREFTNAAISHDAGKVSAVENVLGYYYGKAPSISVFSSDKDMAVSASISGVKLAVCVNSTATDTSCAALISEYQKSELLLDYDSAADGSDTLFVLQGRDENTGEYREDPCVIGFGQTKATISANAEFEKMLSEIKSSCSDTADAIELLSGGEYEYHEKTVYSPKIYTENVSGEKTDITVMSLNIRCGNDEGGHSIDERRPRIKTTVENNSPDIIGLQEVTPEWLDKLNEDYGGEYEIYNVWRDTEELESAPIMWKKDKFECLAKGGFWLSDTPEVMSDGYDPVKRMCQYAVLREISSGREFVAMNTHVGFIEANQIKSCKVMIDYAKKLSDLPLFITGDFNFRPETGGHAAMLSYFSDVNEETAGDSGETFHGYYHGYEPTELVDYCYITDDIEPKESRVLRETFDGKYISDHYALIFKLGI